jgi:hypothetical protein
MFGKKQSIFAVQIDFLARLPQKPRDLWIDIAVTIWYWEVLADFCQY